MLILGDMLETVTKKSMPHVLHVDSSWLLKEHGKAVKPLIESGGKYDGRVKAIIRQQVQPWHHASTFIHEVALAVMLSRRWYILHYHRSTLLLPLGERCCWWWWSGREKQSDVLHRGMNIYILQGA